MNKKISKKVAKAPAIKKVVKKVEIKKPLLKKTKSVKKKVNLKPTISKTNSKINVKLVKIKPAIKKSNKSRIKLKPEVISQDDAEVIEESFNLIKNLNTQVQSVQDVKTKLKEDMKKLDYRLSKHEEKNSNLFNNKYILTIKEELIKEFTPLLNKIDYKSLKVDMFKEIEKILEIEIQKSRTEFDSKSRKTAQDFNKRVTELEMRIIDSLKSNENIKREMKKFEKKEISIIMQEFESRVKSTLENSSAKFIDSLNKTNKDFDSFKIELKEQKKILDNFNKSILDFKKQVEMLVSKDGIDLTSIGSKISKLEKDYLANKQLIEKYENELYNREKDENSKVEQRVKSTLKETEEILDKIKIEKKSGENQIKENIENLKQNLLKTLEKNYSQMNNDANKKLSVAITEFNSEKSTLEKDLELFKVEVSSLIKNYITELDKELNEVKINGANLKTQSSVSSKEFEKKFESYKLSVEKTLKAYEDERSKEKKAINQRADQILKEHSGDLKRIIEENKIIKKSLEVELHLDISDHLSTSKEEISKQIIALNNSLTQIITEAKESQRNLSEDIESKFIVSKEQYEIEFNNHLSSFETELKTKEKEFLDKLKIIEDDKNIMLKELELFKVDISSLTKNYVVKLDEELQSIKAQEINFDDRKKDFLSYIDTLSTVKKVEIEDYSKSLKNSISDVLNKQSQIFEIHENTFRDTFNEKISALYENNKKRLDILDKKFLEKNVKVIDEKILESETKFKLIEEGLISKSSELDKKIVSMEKNEEDFYVQLNSKIEDFSLKVNTEFNLKSTQLDEKFLDMKKKEDMFNSNIESQFHTLNEKVEERLTSYEKQFNKRFLEYDSDFTNFKGTIVDEVEDLIKEVNQIMNTKLETLDKNITKLNFINSEATNKINEFKQIQTVLETEVRDARDEVNDLRVKYEIELTGSNNLNNHVKVMSEYENQLIALIKNLKEKRVSDASIKVALINKGHPRFYVSMILENYSEIINY